MKTRPCEACAEDVLRAYRVQAARGPRWQFVCERCLPGWQAQPGYRYGGTWNGQRHGARAG
jgi:hypothetical protein